MGVTAILTYFPGSKLILNQLDLHADTCVYNDGARKSRGNGLFINQGEMVSSPTPTSVAKIKCQKNAFFITIKFLNKTNIEEVGVPFLFTYFPH